MESLLQKILTLESQCDQHMDNAERKEAEKMQKKKLREVRKLVADTDTGSEDKISSLMTKCIQEIKETTRLQIQTTNQGKQLESVTMARDQAQLELQKSHTLTEKLQTLCRELQKQNKQVAEDSRRTALEEQQKRQEMSDRFGGTVKDITQRLDEHAVERQQQLQENQDLRDKLKQLLEQFDLRESHWEKQLHAKGLEVQLAEAKLEQQVQAAAQMEMKASQFSQQIEIMRETEQELRKQLDSYGEKFKEFQETLQMSNDVFAKMKVDSEKQTKLVRSMEKKLKHGEAERRELKAKSEETSMALIQKMDECAQLERKRNALEALCRTLQNKARSASTLPTEPDARDVSGTEEANSST